jgi:hypothetical protein
MSRTLDDQDIIDAITNRSLEDVDLAIPFSAGADSGTILK